MTANRAYEYCVSALRKKSTPIYVKKQIRQWMPICEGKDKKYCVSESKLRQMVTVLKLLVMPRGLKEGQTLFECTTGYQWLLYTAILCTVYRENPKKRRYEIGVLEICRKNFKTFSIATIFILLFLTEPKFSKFFSVAPDVTLSKQIQEAIAQILRSSPAIYEYAGKKRFRIMRDYIRYLNTLSEYQPLAYSTSRLDGRLPNAYCADEVGALPNSYALEAMRSGQINILNKLGFIISTKYPTIDNPFEDQVAYSKRVLDGIEKDETRFSLLYEPDKTTGWETDDLILKQANPAALEIPEIWEDLLKRRDYAVALESARENFVTKHCNIIYQGAGTETYIEVSAVQKCRTEKIDWRGRDVFLGLDLSESSDNTSVSMVAADDDGTVYGESFAFIPEGRIEEKTAIEKVNYRELLRTNKVIACGDKIIDYSAVEDFIAAIEKNYGVTVCGIGYDKWNCRPTAQKLERMGYELVEVRQHSSVLHPATKLLKEKILAGAFRYEKNPLLEINFQNARCVHDANMNLYVHKMKSRGKVDMVVSLINAMYLLQQMVFLNQMDFVVDVL